MRATWETSPFAKAASVLFMVALYYAIQIPSAWAGVQNPWNAPPSWVVNGAWLYMVVHHVAQMLLAVLVIAVLGGARFAEWGLNLSNAGESLRLLRRFALWFGVFILVGLAIQLATGVSPPAHRPLTIDHVAGGLFFMWVVSGISEEILFRGMIQTWLRRFWRGDVRLARVTVSSAGAVTAVIFTLAHVKVRIAPVEITLSVSQLAIALVLGTFYAVAYDRTGSLLAPALAHNLSNGMMETANLLLARGS